MLKRLRLVAAAAAALALASCASSAVNDVATLEVTLTGAGNVALAYMSQPQCGTPGATVICSDPTIKAQIKLAFDAAYTAVKQAEAVANNTSSSSSDVQKAVAAAQGALAALTQITQSLPKTGSWRDVPLQTLVKEIT